MSRNIKLILILNTVLLVLSLSSCGFHLRGAVKLSSGLSPIYLQQNSAYDLARNLRTLLSSNNIDVVGKPDHANVSLILLSESKTQHVLSVDSRGRAREYSLTYSIKVQFKGVHIKQSSDTISLTRTLLFDPDAVLATANDQAILYRDMQHDAAKRILLKLEALSVSETQKPSKVKTE